MHIIYRLCAAVALVTGSALTIGKSLSFVKADLTGGGAQLMVHAAAPAEAIMEVTEKVSAASELIVGLLLILLGFCLHALLMAHDERTVPIRVVPRKTLHSPQWFWIEMKISR